MSHHGSLMARILQGAGKLNTKMPVNVPYVVKAFLLQLLRRAKDLACFILLVYTDSMFIFVFFEAVFTGLTPGAHWS